MTGQQFDPDFIRELRQRIDAKQAELESEPAETGLVPLVLQCAMSACKNGRHCLDHLRRPRKGDPAIQPGQCRDCGTVLFDLPRPGRLNYGDLEAILTACSQQQSELIRAHYWHVQIDQWAFNQARRLGLVEVRRRVAAAVTEAMTSADSWAGRAASYHRKIVAYAQHATATCCRRCAAYWHGLPADPSVLPTGEQLTHVVAAALAWVEIRLADLPAEGEAHVPHISATDMPSPERVSELDDAVFEALGHGQDPVGLLVSVGSLLQIKPSRGRLLIQRQMPLHGYDE